MIGLARSNQGRVHASSCREFGGHFPIDTDLTI